MGIASLVIGIISLILGCVPFCGYIILVPCIVGIILGIIAIITKKQRGMAIAGVITGILAIIIFANITSKVPNLNTIFDSTTGSNQLKSEYHLGESAEHDGIKVTLKTIEIYKEDNIFMQPNDGNKYIKVYCEFENTGDSDKYVTDWDFDGYVDNTKVEQRYLDNSSVTATLSKGKKSNGYVYFEVPNNSNKITIEYHLSVWTDSKIVYTLEY